ncbi:MAG TPA: winged helix-turn-helix domain-containing protein [Solirubrobacterales bacterium]|nr:winged helix-turn-helix domain-containing protein [Solirubrobacterales bacterium]
MPYALQHPTRVKILTVLNEGTFTPGQTAEAIGETLSKVSNHIRELLEAGSIEIAKQEQVRNTVLHYYRAIEMPFYSDAEIAALPPEQREISAGLVFQRAFAEAFASLAVGKLQDPHVWLTCRWFNVDQQGRDEIMAEQGRSWRRVRDIEIEAVNRRAKSGEESTSIIVTHLGYPRARKGPQVSPPSPEREPSSLPFTRDMTETATFLPGRNGKRIEEVVPYAIRHPTRVKILTVLNEGTFTPGQTAEAIGEPLNKVSNHIRELLEAGSIEIVKQEQVRNTVLHYYRAIEMPFYSDAEIAALPPAQREISAGLVLQTVAAEAIASLAVGKLQDPHVWLTCRWFNVDQQGRDEIMAEQERSWCRVQEIEVESTARCVESKEESTSIIITRLGYPRARKGPQVLLPSPEGERSFDYE